MDIMLSLVGEQVPSTYSWHGQSHRRGRGRGEGVSWRAVGLWSWLQSGQQRRPSMDAPLPGLEPQKTWALWL